MVSPPPLALSLCPTAPPRCPREASLSPSASLRRRSCVVGEHCRQLEAGHKNRVRRGKVPMRKHNPIRAVLANEGIAEACGLVANSSSPVLALCRKLVAAAYDPTTPLEAYLQKHNVENFVESTD